MDPDAPRVNWAFTLLTPGKPAEAKGAEGMKPKVTAFVSKSTIPGEKPWRLTVFEGTDNRPVGHIELGSRESIPAGDVESLVKQSGYDPKTGVFNNPDI